MKLAQASFKLLFVLVLGLQIGSGVARADTQYTVNTTITSTNPTGTSQTDSIVGTITTDGASVIGSGDVISYNLDLIDDLNPANNIDLTSSNSTVVEDTGGDLIATASGIAFNFSNPGEFLIQANSPGPFSGYSYFCYSTGGACLYGETISPNYIYTDGAILTGDSAPVGVTGLNQNPGTGTSMPEPSSLLLMLIGLLAVSLSARGKRFVGGSGATC
jgi:PEP-CTERM motif